MNKEVMEYGPHLLLDCYDADPGRLGNISLVCSVLEELPGLIGMERVGFPQVARFADPSKAGVSGLVMIATSHISIHTYTLKRCFFMDVFSCQPFSTEAVVGYVKEKFKASDLEVRLINRGSRFPIDNIVGRQGG